MNILLTTLSTLPTTLSMNYYHYNGMFCTGISQQEAGTKTTISSLSKNRECLDKLVIVGSNVTIKEDDETFIKNLLEYSFEKMDINHMSPYMFFLYRIQQFLQNKDKELEKTKYTISESTKEKFEQYLLEKGIGIEELVQKQHSENLNNILGQEFKNIKPFIYNQISNNKKMRNIVTKMTNLQVTFVPNQISVGNIMIDNISGIIKEIAHPEEINLYIDMQGGGRTDGFVRNSVLSILNNNVNENIHVKAIWATDFHPKWIINNVINELPRYKISDLVSGMDAFLRYAKVDQLYEYVGSYENEEIGYLLDIMKDIDESLSLCDVQKLELSIQELKDYFNTQEIEITDSISDIFSILEKDIKQDYGELLEGNEINTIQLIKWAMRKKFYQQALTIIEARFPRVLVEEGIYFYAKKDSQEQVKQVFQSLYSKTKPYERYKFDDIDHYFIKYYDKAIKLDPNLPRIRPLTLSRDVKKVDKLKKIYFSLSRMRNESNHSSEKGRTSLEDVIKTIERLLETYEDIKKEIKNRKSPSVSISSEQIIKKK